MGCIILITDVLSSGKTQITGTTKMIKKRRLKSLVINGQKGTRFAPLKMKRVKIPQKMRMMVIQTLVLHYPSLAVEYSGGLWAVVQKQILKRS